MRKSYVPKSSALALGLAIAFLTGCVGDEPQAATKNLLSYGFLFFSLLSGYTALILTTHALHRSHFSLYIPPAAFLALGLFLYSVSSSFRDEARMHACKVILETSAGTSEEHLMDGCTQVVNAWETKKQKERMAERNRVAEKMKDIAGY